MKKFEVYGMKNEVYGYEIITVKGCRGMEETDIAKSKSTLDEIIHVEEI